MWDAKTRPLIRPVPQPLWWVSCAVAAAMKSLGWGSLSEITRTDWRPHSPELFVGAV